MNRSFLNIRLRLFWTSAVALVLALGCFSLAHWVYAPSDDLCHWRIEEKPAAGVSVEPQPRVFIRAIIPKGPVDAAGLADGDELLAIHDKKISPYSDKLTYQENRSQIFRDILKLQEFINSAQNGTVVQYTVLREGQVIALPVELKKAFDVINALLLLTGLVAWAIGLMVVLSTPQRKVARHFYYLGILALLLSAAYSTRGNYTVPAGFDLLTWLCNLLFYGLMPPMWLHFFLRFPHRFEIRNYRPFLIGIYAINILLVLASVVAGAVSAKDSIWLLRLFLESLPLSEIREMLESARAYFHLALLGAGVAIFFAGVFKIPRNKRKALLAPLCLTVAVLLDMLAYVWLSRQYAGTQDWYVFYHSSFYFFLPFPFLPITFALAILRHGLFDVRRVIVRWLTYFISLGALIAIYLGLLAWLFTLIIPEKIPLSWLGVIMGLLALPLAWTLRWLLTALRRRFRRDLTSAREIILGNLRDTKKRFSEAALLDSFVASIQETFRPQVCYFLPIVAGRTHLPKISVSQPSDPTIQPDKNYAPPEIRLPKAMLRHARDNREVVYGLGHDESDWISSQGKALRSYIDAIGAQVLVLVMTDDIPHSLLLLGGKYSELNYSREDRELLREVATAVGIALESAILHNLLIDKTRLDQELQAARSIQKSLITSHPPATPGFQIALRLVPAMETGGDLLWVAERAPGQWIAAVGDVSGKGLAAAIYMSQSMALLDYAARKPDTALEKISKRMDHALRNLMSSKDFLTICLIEWHKDGKFRVVRAGHPPPILLASGGPVHIAPPGLALGMRPASPIEWHAYEGVLQPGEWIAMFSDGLTEAMDQNGDLYGTNRITEQLLRFWGTGSPAAACEAIFQQVASFEVQNKDDRTLFILARQ